MISFELVGFVFSSVASRTTPRRISPVLDHHPMDSLLPEFLSVDELQTRLRHFVQPDRLSADKTELVALAHRYLVPAPQRQFRPNRLGTQLTQTQEQLRVPKRPHSPDSNSVSSPTKHESDRGIYTIHRQTSSTKSTAPIKLKRPPVVRSPSSSLSLHRIEFRSTGPLNRPNV